MWNPRLETGPGGGILELPGGGEGILELHGGGGGSPRAETGPSLGIPGLLGDGVGSQRAEIGPRRGGIPGSASSTNPAHCFKWNFLVPCN